MNGLQNWDPLEESNKLRNKTAELASATVKRHIGNILKSYTGYYDPFSELIQNALDAVEERMKNTEKEKYIPTIWITIDLKNNAISITDNGIGFLEDEFKSFLAPNISFKVDSRGKKGVGATYLAYGFNFLQIGTKSLDSDFAYIGTLKGGREWVEDESGTKARPKVSKDSEAIHEIFNEISYGSTFTLKLIGEHTRPKSLTWIGATNADQWESILKIKTPLGGIYLDKKCLLSKCYLRVIDEEGNETKKEITDFNYVYPHKVIGSCKELDEIKKAQQKLTGRGEDAGKLPAKFYKLNGLFNYWDHEAFAKSNEFPSRSLNEQEKELAKKFQISCYGFFGCSVKLWDKFNDEILKLRKDTRILRGGLQLATNRMPQGELLTIPLTKNIGYQKVAHVIVHFNNADPDLGRKGFQPELVSLAKRVSTTIVYKFMRWRKYLIEETGVPPSIREERDIYEWIKKQEEHEKNNPLIIRREDVFLPLKEPSMTSVPLNEQDVVSLFNQLLAGGVIRGVKVMSTSQYKHYDGISRTYLKKPFENHIFDKEKNPLGIDGSRINEEFESVPIVLEYKYSFDGLLEEIEKEEKSEDHIQLVVAWKMGENWTKRYTITPLLHFDNIHHREFHGCTHIILDGHTGREVFKAIILSELIDYINDPEKVQKDQEDKYMGSI